MHNLESEIDSILANARRSFGDTPGPTGREIHNTRRAGDARLDLELLDAVGADRLAAQ